MTQGLSDFEPLHAIRVGGLHAAKPDNADELAERGLIFVTPVGCMLTEKGNQQHAELLEQQRAELDVEAVGALYERFLAVNQPCKSKCSAWQNLADDDFDDRFMIATDLQDILERVSTTITRTSEHLPRFAGYPPRMETALDRVLEGESGVPHEPDRRELPQRLDGVPRGLPADPGHLPRGRGQLLMSTTSISTAVVAFDAAGEPDANRLGGKGASLVKMVGLGMPVPPGFVLSTDIGREYLSHERAPRRRHGASRRGAARGSSSSSTASSATRTPRCWSRSAPARRSRCRA